ncbi:MAG: hypothetical protein NY202_02345 [Mollicutes bacterium UO1]
MTRKGLFKTEDNELLIKLNIKVFKKDFLGKDDDKPDKKKF